MIQGNTIILYGIFASLCAGLATGVGSLPVLFTRGISDKLMDSMLGFAAGVMLAATSFSLMVPAIEYGGVWITAVGFLAGGAFIHLIDKYIPHEHFILGHEGPASPSLRKIWLFVLAITIHNFPEGLAVGVGFGSGDVAAGTTLAIGIGIQNAPEGLAVALALVREKYKPSKALWYGTLTGLVEPVGGVIGATIVVLAQPMLPFFLAFAGGAMLFVISDEIIPETHSRGHERAATFGVMLGFLIMTLLDNML